jgi:hypothetical protein
MAAMRAPESIDELRARKADHRTEASDLRMELDVAHSEAIRLVIDAQPHLNRLEMVAHEIGPTALQSVQAVRALLERNVTRRTPNPEGTAA